MDTKRIDVFLEKYKFCQPKVDELTRDLLMDMWNGLTDKKLSDEAMIVVPRSVPKEFSKNTSAIIIDAGGTNFRSCLVTSDCEGKLTVSDLRKTSMPAIKERLSKDEFYAAIADNIDYLKNKAARIGFCFSYAMEMDENCDGKVLVFSKEINAPEVIGTYVARELTLALKKKGWESIEKISMVNDTMACLLSGTVQPDSASYDSYIGFILGTGINNAYIEPKLDSKIIVCECGMYGKISQSDFDVYVDEGSVNKGKSKLEKMCSGAYLSQIALHILKKAGSEGLFTSDMAEKYASMKELSMIEIGEILDKIPESEDEEILHYILKSVIERAARIVASVLAATVISSGKGKNRSNPICIVCNGTTFWKTTGLKNLVSEYLTKTLTGEWERYYEIKKIDEDIVSGTYASAF